MACRIRDGFLNLLRSRRPEIARLMQTGNGSQTSLSARPWAWLIYLLKYLDKPLSKRYSSDKIWHTPFVLTEVTVR